MNARIKTFVVNMEKDTEKRARIEEQLASHPMLDYEIIKAVEGRKLSTDELAQQCDWDYFVKKYGKGATLPAIGCSLSHYSIYKRIADDCLDFALVLEDDALLCKDLEAIIFNLISILNNTEPTVTLLTPEFTYYKNNFTAKINDYKVYKLWTGVMTSGYLINNRGAKLLKDKLFPVRFVADDFVEFHKMGLKIYGVVPHLVSFPKGLGEIGKSVWNQYSFLTKLKRPLGKLKLKLHYYKLRKKGYYISKKMW